MKHTPDTIKESLRRCTELRSKYWGLLPEDLRVYVRLVEIHGKGSKRQATRARNCFYDAVMENKDTEACIKAVHACAARNNGVWGE